MLSPELKNHITNSYAQIDEIVSAVKVDEGYLSQNHLINTQNNRYFLKQYNQRYTIKHIEDVHKVIMYFSNNNIPCLTPIKNTQNETFFEFNSKIFTLFPFVNANTGNRDNVSFKTIESVAKNLAKIHLLSSKGVPISISKYQSPIDIKGFQDLYPKITNSLYTKNEMDNFDKLAIEVLELKKKIVEENKNKSYEVITDHLLHGDYHEKNTFLDRNGGVKYIFDWDNTKIGDRLNELIRSMHYICFEGDFSRENFQKAKHYVQTYNNMYPFNRDSFLESLEIHYLKKAHSLWIETTHYLENSKRVDCFLKAELTFLKCFPENKKNLIDIILVSKKSLKTKSVF